MLKHDKKVRIITLKEEGLLSEAIAKGLGWHMLNLLKFTIPTGKRALAGILRWTTHSKPFWSKRRWNIPPWQLLTSTTQYQNLPRCGVDHPEYPPEGPEDATSACCHEAASHQKNEGQEDEICQNLSEFHLWGFGQRYFFRWIYLPVHQGLQEQGEETEGPQQVWVATPSIQSSTLIV